MCVVVIQGEIVYTHGVSQSKEITYELDRNGFAQLLPFFWFWYDAMWVKMHLSHPNSRVIGVRHHLPQKCSIVRGAHIRIPYYAPPYCGTPHMREGELVSMCHLIQTQGCMFGKGEACGPLNRYATL